VTEILHKSKSVSQGAEEDNRNTDFGKIHS